MWHAEPKLAELDLKRASGDRRLYMLDGVGSIRFEGLLSRNATTESNGERVRAAASRDGGVPRSTKRARPSAGSSREGFGAAVRSRGASREASNWRERYALTDGETELATPRRQRVGRRQVAVSIDESAALEEAAALRGPLEPTEAAGNGGSAASGCH